MDSSCTAVVRTCPFCAAPCGVSDRLCGRCDRAIGRAHRARTLAPGELEQTRARLRELAAGASPDWWRAADGRDVTPEVSPRIKLAACAAMCVASGALVAVGPVVAVFGVLTACVFACAAIALVVDSAPPHPRHRRDPAAAVTGFLHTVRARRWDDALVYLSPITRDRTVSVPHVPELEVDPAAAQLSSGAGVQRYWAPFSDRHRDARRRIRKFSVMPAAADDGGRDGDVRCVQVTLSVAHYPRGRPWVILAATAFGVAPAVFLWFTYRSTWTVRFAMAAHRYGEQWYVVTGELASPLDARLAEEA